MWQRAAAISPEFKGQALLIAGMTCTGLAAGEEMEELSPSATTGAWIKLKCFHLVGRRRFKRVSRNTDTLKSGGYPRHETATRILQPQSGPETAAIRLLQITKPDQIISSLRPQVSTQTQVVQITS
jgi:hypothetical protein